ncbi:hypothetical protein [Salipiger aestuarii]|uniref:Uncharacterized protein n=1 Tax=Salipiger aestuarii TaxID=568098 RepID=A0A327YCI4_9RHOB|nr:hypothetical protein [Salipiger aestuarii]RAK18788.1 hypothetical protein ATI53_101167 [Salipiger aestuarii]
MPDRKPQEVPTALVRDDLHALVLGGLWPACAALETLLDRIEAREILK